jgi:sulfoxide reductase heme-binding subunit YedZ
VSQLRQTRTGPPLARHVAAVSLTVGLMLLFFWLDGGGSLPLYHAVPADTSFALLCLVLMLGAGARLVPRLRPAMPWGRELGIGMFVTAGLHVAIVLDPEFLGVFPSFEGESDSMWDAAWWVGQFALAYAVVLAATSNDWSQRTLGRGWKFVQRQVYTLFLLTFLHTAAYVMLGAGHGHALAVWLFLGLTAAAVLSQFAGFIHTVRAPRGPSPHRVPPKVDASNSGVVSKATARWLGVVALWGGVIVGSWLLAHAPSAEDRLAPLLCEIFLESGGTPTAEDRDELMELVADEPPGTLGEWLEGCEDG